MFYHFGFVCLFRGFVGCLEKLQLTLKKRGKNLKWVEKLYFLNKITIIHNTAFFHDIYFHVG